MNKPCRHLRSSGPSRRDVLGVGASLLGGLALSPGLATRSLARAARQAGAHRRLVLVQLSGGNDGLATVVPYADDAYQRERQTTAFQRDEVLVLDDYRGLHPELVRLRELYERGELALIEGVGYPRPVLSHFRSLDIWHTADHKGRAAGDGWIPRLAEAAWPDERQPEVVVHVGGFAPYSLHSTTRPPTAFETPSSYRSYGAGTALSPLSPPSNGDEQRQPAADLSPRDEKLARLRALQADAQRSSASVRAAAARYRPTVSYPKHAFGASLHDVAALIHSDLGSRVLSVRLGGFDTHASQRGEHDTLMRVVDECLGAFLADLANSSAGRDTVVVCFSEFGRRVAENASRGHDHGKAGLMLVLGSSVKGGLHGAHPSLTELDAGDLVFTTDFRSVYAAVIEDWFGADAQAVLGESYPRLDLFGA